MTISNTTVEELSEMKNTNEELEAIIEHVVIWHKALLVYLETLAEIPSGTSFSVDDSEPIVLEGDAHRAFEAGVYVALAAINKLPFSEVYEEEGKEDKNVTVH